MSSTGPHRDDGPERDDDLPRLDVVIPDDARELDAEIWAYRVEQRRVRVRARLRRLLFTRRWEAYGLSGPLVVLVLLIVAVFGSLASIFSPRVSPPPAALPLATGVAERPGEVGALVPDVPLTMRGMDRPARALRPAVLALVPAGCDCGPAVDSLHAQAASYQLRLVLVATPAHLREVAALRPLSGGAAFVAVDREDALGPAYDASGLTAVLVHGDGIVENVVRDIGPATRVEHDLAGLNRAGSGPATRS